MIQLVQYEMTVMSCQTKGKLVSCVLSEENFQKQKKFNKCHETEKAPIVWEMGCIIKQPLALIYVARTVRFF